MALSSSPVVYPPSSSPEIPTHLKKRPAPDEQQQPKQKKRLFGAERWDAANIPVIPAIEEKGAEREPSKSSPSREDVHTTASFQPRPRPVFIEPPHKPDVVPPRSHRPDTLETTANEPAWSFPSAKEPSELFRSRTCSGKQFVLCRRPPRESKSYERTIAERSTTAAGRATTSYYGIEIHKLIDEANVLNAQPALDPTPTVVPTVEESTSKKRRPKNTMWTEKYRARKFVDLVGDERTHRAVLRWLKGWDSIVFPGAAKPPGHAQAAKQEEEGRSHRKILLLTGPPGLGKTTLAHVCAKQAGYEVVEINASDERSRDVVRGRIRDCVGTENVRGQNSKVGGDTVRKAGRPVCVVVDEVDGVVSGSGGSGDGGFMKALVDLVQLDQRNSSNMGESEGKNKKKGDKFRLLRPMILICNDVYHPALRILRSSNIAEIVHVRKAALDKVVSRLKGVFEREGIPSDIDGVRRLCEATWGVSRKKDDAGSQSTGDGDLRSVLVVGEWAARKLRASTPSTMSLRLTRSWVEKSMLADLTTGNSARGLGRGGARETAERVFLENAGFSRSTISSTSTSAPAASNGSIASVSAASLSSALSLLRTAVETTGEVERTVTDIFTAYPSRPFQDDTFLSKPNAAAEWLYFHDTMASRVYSGQEWELAAYLATPVLGFHTLFGSTNQFSAYHGSNHHNNNQYSNDETEAPAPFSGPRADFEASEAHKATRAQLQSWHGTLSVELFRQFRSPEHLACDLVPYVARLLAPSVSPVLINSGARGEGASSTASVRKESEKDMVRRAAGAMVASGVGFEKVRVEDSDSRHGGMVWRMEPPIDELSTYPTATASANPPAGTAAGTTSIAPPTPIPSGTRFATRQVLAQEHAKLLSDISLASRQARFDAGSPSTSGPATGGASAASTSSRLASSTSLSALANSSAAAAAMSHAKIKRDFFGRPIVPSSSEEEKDGERPGSRGTAARGKGKKASIWVTFHEGFSNAVRKPVSLGDIMAMI